MKLNKLLFFAQGHCLSQTWNPLFDDSFVAMTHGPVILDVYNKYAICGHNPIVSSGIPIPEDAFTNSERNILFDIYREYGIYTASYLRNRTHLAGTPWALTPKNEVIDNELIREYFAGKGKIPTFDDILVDSGIPIINTRDNDGYLVLPADDYLDEEYAF